MGAIGRGRLSLAVRPIPVVLGKQGFALGFVTTLGVGLEGFIKRVVTTQGRI
jgi:hypothetical protein